MKYIKDPKNLLWKYIGIHNRLWHKKNNIMARNANNNKIKWKYQKFKVQNLK